MVRPSNNLKLLEIYKTILTQIVCCRHTTTGVDWKKEMVNATDNEVDLYDMAAGERYTIQVNTFSYGVESKHPLEVNHTVREYTCWGTNSNMFIPIKDCIVNKSVK